MSNPSDELEPNTVVCQCQLCSGGIEFDARQAGETVACPHCGSDTILFVPTADQKPPVIAPSAQPPPVPQSIWFGSEASVLEIQLISGANLKIKAVRLYDAAELNEISAQKAYAAELFNGSSSPYGAIGDPLWVVFATTITRKIEQTKSREMAQNGVALIQKIAAREQKLRERIEFFPVGQIQEIENTIPSLWTVLRAGSRFVHSEEEFITVTDTDDVVKKFRWSCVESYNYQSNSPRAES
jgi:hypothetical protein